MFYSVFVQAFFFNVSTFEVKTFEVKDFVAQLCEWMGKKHPLKGPVVDITILRKGKNYKEISC